MWLFMRTSPEGLFLFHRPPEFFKFFFPFGGAARVPSHACEQCGLHLFGIRFFWGANSLDFPLCQLIRAREALSFLSLSFQLS